ncbi:tyrosine aminotransferase [Bombyx mandarina]|uniref:Tyrosine aminotransferase n=1 Tax=Bombyx mandarina TaxID=7092 RepID=A0A6J2K5X1_BOMMA|nr:tyrosine aminotransferase [Bombyx mandarina]XP_028037350.1 tyrosine aminotransferase [Bombyx mandarina]
MSRRSRRNPVWEVRASTLARNTRNLIREIIENLDVQPNPDKQLIALSVGDPTTFGNLNPPDQVLQAVRESIEWHTSRGYGPAKGHIEARQAVAEYSAHQGHVTAEDVVLCSGCSHAIELAVSVLADSGQNVLVPRPGFMIYKTLAEGLGIDIKYYNLLSDQQWRVDLDDLENQIDDDTAAIIVINPSNPCGSVYSREHLQDILEVASRNRLPIIADEIYEHFVFSDHEFISMSALSKDVPILTCSGLTKRFLVPGWRMGWIVIHDRNNIFGKEVRKGLNNLATRILGPSTLIQRALPTILKNTPQSFFDEVVLFIENQAKLAYKELVLAPGLRPIMPQGAMYMMIEIKTNKFPEFKNELQFVERLMSEQSVFCLPGQCFEFPNYMRIVLTVPEEILREACRRIIIFCQEHVVSREKILEIDENVVVSSEAEIIRKKSLTTVT